MMINERGLTQWSCYAFDMALIYGFTDRKKKTIWSNQLKLRTDENLIQLCNFLKKQRWWFSESKQFNPKPTSLVRSGSPNKSFNFNMMIYLWSWCIWTLKIDPKYNNFVSLRRNLHPKTPPAHSQVTELASPPVFGRFNASQKGCIFDG